MTVTSGGWAGRASKGLCAALAALALAACATPQPPAPTATGPTEAELRAALAESLAAPETRHPAALAEYMKAQDRALAPLYEARGFDPIWVDENGATERGVELFRRLAEAEADALNPDRYVLSEIAAPLGDGDAGSLASAELYFSRALMRYAADLRGIDNYDPVVVALAGSTLDFGAYLDTLAPANPDYRRLRAAMKLYMAIEEDGGWTLIPRGGKLKRGMSGVRVLDLRSRLGATGDLAATDALSGSRLFDRKLAAAVKKFQARHGLVADGIAGKRTLAALNVPVRDRIATLAGNLEQYRNSDLRFGDRAVIVNVTAAELVVIEDGEVVLRSRTIVGKQGWRTPLMSSTITSIELNPTWTVPRSITLSEIVPTVGKRGDGYLRKRGFRLFDMKSRELDMSAIDWSKVDENHLPFILRQDPGPRNALGHVKFLFPNDQDIYLHDTPSRRLFARANRAVSHGCVRVRKADALALVLLRHDKGWDRKAYEQALADGTTIRLKLSHPMPLHLVSFTAWVEADGTVQFRKPYSTAKPAPRASPRKS